MQSRCWSKRRLILSHLLSGRLIHRTITHVVDYIVWSVLQKRVYRTNISGVDELKRRTSSDRTALSHAIIERAVGEWR